MLIEVKTPEMSESVQSGSLLVWRKQVGDPVRRDETLLELETDKVILEVAAPADGMLTEIRVPVGGEVKAGDVLALIDNEAIPAPTPAAITPPAPPPSPAQATGEKPAAAVLPPSARRESARHEADAAPVAKPQPAKPAQPVVARGEDCPPCPSCMDTSKREDRRVQMSRLRQRIAERLKEAQNNAAMLTTFNEVNMQPVMDLRAKYKERFMKEHGVKLGFMSFFTKAVCQALKVYPLVNASVDGRDVVYHDYYDIGIAVSSARGLVVPILRNAERMTFSTVEKQIADFGRRAGSLELTLEEMEGGTFTITNGGVFGSLLSTPILNPPQSGVLGLHKIQERPIAENGQVVIRPLMYVALTYDHRIIDGREAVSFLVAVKDALEDPARLLLEL
jgi:2-oxoglutarate dehydrogenase E2 component (dihydrolipoamide succinyltransferase)